jgi:phage-related protein
MKPQSDFEHGKQQAQTAAEKAKEGFSQASQKVGEGLSTAGQKVREAAGVVAEKARESVGALGESAASMGSAAMNKADEAVSAAGKRLEDWGEGVRKNTPNEGIMGTCSNTLASTLETSGKYLEDHGLSGIVEDVTETIKRNPVAAMFIGVGIGFLLAKALSPRS